MQGDSSSREVMKSISLSYLTIASRYTQNKSRLLTRIREEIAVIQCLPAACFCNSNVILEMLLFHYITLFNIRLTFDVSAYLLFCRVFKSIEYASTMAENMNM
jgi:hypothetical protein